jgi:polyisoprenoid-binding protein YceI
MTLTDTLKRRWPWLLLIVPVTIIVLLEAGTFVYIHFIEPDPPAPLAFSSASGSASSDAGDPSATAAGAVDGTWTITSGSEVGYRVHEVLSGQDNEAAGRTTSVTGQLAIGGTTINTASFTVQMDTVTSDEAQRDGQFKGRIMRTAKFPTATFTLTAPISLASIPDNLTEVTVSATGNLTLVGVTKPVTFDLKARRSGAHLEVNGSIPITFSDFDIDNPSGGPAQVGDTGQLEFLLIFGKA